MGTLNPPVKTIAGAFLILLAACSTPTDTDEDFSYFIVQVDRLKAPEDFWVGDTLNIQLFGVIGTNGCKSFSHFEDMLEFGDLSYTLDFTVWGKRDKKAIVCPAVMVMLDHQYSFFPHSPGMLTINVHQSDSTILRDYIRIHSENIIID